MQSYFFKQSFTRADNIGRFAITKLYAMYRTRKLTGLTRQVCFNYYFHGLQEAAFLFGRNIMSQERQELFPQYAPPTNTDFFDLPGVGRVEITEVLEEKGDIAQEQVTQVLGVNGNNECPLPFDPQKFLLQMQFAKSRVRDARNNCDESRRPSWVKDEIEEIAQKRIEILEYARKKTTQKVNLYER